MAWTFIPMKDPNDYLKEDQIEAFFYAINNYRDKALFITLLHSSRRVSEIVRSLRPNDINFYDNFIAWNILKKKNKYKIPLESDKELMKVLKNYIDWTGIKPENYVFPITRQRVWQLIRKIGAKAGIEKARLHPHIFRHTWITRAMRSGMAIDMVKHITQHSDINMTMAYSHFAPQDIRNSMEKMWSNA